MKQLSWLSIAALAACGNVKNGPDPLDPTIPHVTASTDRGDTIHVQWTPADGASTYQLWRAEDEDGDYELIVVGDTTEYDDTGLGHSDVKFYRAIGCDDDGACDAESEVSRGYTVPGVVTLDGCTHGSEAAAITCWWEPADDEVDGEISYELHADGVAAGTATGTEGAAVVAPGTLYTMTIAIANSETGVGPASNPMAGYAESVVIVYDDTDPPDTIRAGELERILETDVTAVPGAAGAMPSLPTVLVPASLVASTFTPDSTWAGRPMILSAGFDRSDEGTLRNLAADSPSVLAFGEAVALFDAVNAYGGDWGPGPAPWGLTGYSEFGGYTDAVVVYSAGDVFTTPLYATGYGTSPLEGTAESFTDGPTAITAVYLDGSSNAGGLCRLDATVLEWYACAEQYSWGALGYLDPPDTASGKVVLINMVARFAAM